MPAAHRARDERVICQSSGRPFQPLGLHRKKLSLSRFPRGIRVLRSCRQCPFCSAKRRGAVLSMDRLIGAMERALDQYSAAACGKGRSGASSTVGDGGHAFYGVMPAYISEPPALGTSWCRCITRTRRWACRRTLATIVLLDPETGGCRPSWDGRYITEARTAAVSRPRRSTWPARRARTGPSLGPAAGAKPYRRADEGQEVRRSARLEPGIRSRAGAARGGGAAGRTSPRTWWRRVGHEAARART